MFLSPISALAFCATGGWAKYLLQDDYFEQDFFSQWEFFTDTDPTHGFVNYTNKADSEAAGLISSTSSNAIMRVDSTNICPNGRQSVRITSNQKYNVGSLIVIDIDHMPGGICGTWPAFWTLGPNWPHGGEVDIMEGVNDQLTNDATLHTGPGCSISDNGGFTGNLTSSNCLSGSSGNNGCQISDLTTGSYGVGFNQNGGGVYATQWTSDDISVYFFPRGSIPHDVLGNHPDPSKWGQPMAKFSGACDFSQSFVDQQLVFDTTFCGDWAGGVWATSACAKKADTCQDYVANNPTAFRDAYWSVNALKVYCEKDGDHTSTPPTDNTTSTSPAGTAASGSGPGTSGSDAGDSAGADASSPLALAVGIAGSILDGVSNPPQVAQAPAVNDGPSSTNADEGSPKSQKRHLSHLAKHKRHGHDHL